MERVANRLSAASCEKVGSGLKKRRMPVKMRPVNKVRKNQNLCLWYNLLSASSVPSWRSQKPEYHNMTIYQAKGNAITGIQPICHQKFNPWVMGLTPSPNIAEWLIKNIAPNKRPPAANQIPQIRDSAFKKTVSPSHSRRMVLKSETAR